MHLLHCHVEVRTALAAAAAGFCSLNGAPPFAGRGRREWRPAISFRPIVFPRVAPSPRSFSVSDDALTAVSAAAKEGEKPAICTADELHYVAVPGTEWKLALWRYRPPPEVPKRNHPLMLLSGVGTNAIGFDLSPGASFARHMSNQGFDTWIVEVRGAGLSKRTDEWKAIYDPLIKPVISIANSVDEANQKGVMFVGEKMVGNSCSMPDPKSANVMSVGEKMVGNLGSMPDPKNTNVNGKMVDSFTWNEPKLVTELSDTFMRLAERLSGYLNEGQLRDISDKFFDQISKLLEDARLSKRFNEITENISTLLETRQNSAFAEQIKDLSQRLVNVIEEGHRSVSPQLFDLQERLSTTIQDFQKQLDLIVTYNWDFDNYLEEDIPAAVR